MSSVSGSLGMIVFELSISWSMFSSISSQSYPTSLGTMVMLSLYINDYIVDFL